MRCAGDTRSIGVLLGVGSRGELSALSARLLADAFPHVPTYLRSITLGHTLLDRAAFVSTEPPPRQSYLSVSGVNDGWEFTRLQLPSQLRRTGVTGRGLRCL